MTADRRLSERRIPLAVSQFAVQDHARLVEQVRVLRELLSVARMFVSWDHSLKCLPSETDRECLNRTKSETIAAIDTALATAPRVSAKQEAKP